MTGKICPVCAGSLWVITWTGSQPPPQDCPACLTVPACDELRWAARQAFGVDPRMYGLHDWPPFGPWWQEDAPDERIALEAVPAYLPAGRDLLARALAQAHGVPAYSGALFTQYSANTWELRGTVQPGGMYAGGQPHLDSYARRFCAVMTDGERRLSDRRGMRDLFVEVPALADIPSGANPHARATRALVLAWAATRAL